MVSCQPIVHNVYIICVVIIFIAKDKQITGLIYQLESLQKKQHFDSLQLVHQKNVHFTLGIS